MKRFVCLFLFGLSLSVSSAMGATFYVGTCHSGSFSTISAAVNAVPAGSVINVCLGEYDEQVIISKSLTLQGLSSQNPDEAKVIGFGNGSTTQSLVLGLDLQPTIWIKSGTGPSQTFTFPRVDQEPRAVRCCRPQFFMRAALPER